MLPRVLLYRLYSRLFKLKQKLREAKYQAQGWLAGEAWYLERIWFFFQLHLQLRIHAECQGRKFYYLEFPGEAISLFGGKQNWHSSRNLFQFTCFNMAIEIFIFTMHQLYSLKSKRFHMSNWKHFFNVGLGKTRINAVIYTVGHSCPLLARIATRLSQSNCTNSNSWYLSTSLTGDSRVFLYVDQEIS